MIEHNYVAHEREGWSVCTRCGMVRNYDQPIAGCRGVPVNVNVKRAEIERAETHEKKDMRVEHQAVRALEVTDATYVEVGFAGGKITMLCDMVTDAVTSDRRGRRRAPPRRWSVWDGRWVRQGARERASGLHFAHALLLARALVHAKTDADALAVTAEVLARRGRRRVEGGEPPGDGWDGGP